MRVLKGRYKTQPRIAKSTSMSALHRLADPLMGYDSIEALAPKERTLRRESVERRLGQALASGNPGGQGRLLNTTRPSRTNNTVLGRSSSGGSIPQQTPMAISVNAVSLQDRRQRSIGSTAVQQRRGYRPGSRWERSKTQEIAVSPLLRLRASGGRRVKPTLRRKRVATMRSVNGWVKEADPASMRRQNSLDRRFIALREKRNRKPKGKRKDSRPLAHSSGATARDSRAFDGSTFLTEVETDVTTAELKLGVSTGDDTSAHGTSTTLAPAWGSPGSHSVGPLEARLTWQENEAGTSSRPCSEWQLLRRNEKSSSRPAKMLHSFENKVGSPLQLRQQHPPTSVASNDEPAAQLLLSENSGPGDRWRPPDRSSPRRSDTKEPHPSESRLALMHHRPSSKSWVHRRSLPSLLSNTTEPPSSLAGTSSTSTLTRGSPAAAAAGGGGAILRKRGRRRPSLDEPSGLMQQLDKNYAVTVGDTWGGGLSRRGAGKRRDEDDGGVEGVSAEAEAAGRGGTPSVVGCVGVGGDGATLTAAARPGSRGQGSTSSGRLLSSAIPKPLLYVGSGGGFRLRS
ncbi:hypothetical protein Esi_0187_0053 [Ectocarpus siliculosus]|uniref:Uncharacterized protein n=1 Tax=Ectocarpus siliculosus TaxID=2880 RepID=D7FP91_ECTSI|nr:hypothetical protein Esi_0187_0053 [Ectocarpus siliculosus]|eukprot:CBJ30352.1 hypothetical protein Esi_0187_0053 [Ectocarpus siliculosus]